MLTGPLSHHHLVMGKWEMDSTPLLIIDQLEEELLSKWYEFESNNNHQGYNSLRLENFYNRASNHSTVQDGSRIVLVTHLSVDRIKDRLPLLLEFWQGPASIAIHLSDVRQIYTLSRTLRELPTTDQWRILGRDAILHFLLESHAPSTYPHNRLRNLAMHYDFGTLNDQGDLCLAVDVDFVPPWNAHGQLIQLLYADGQSMEPSLHSALQNRTALVLPVFNLVPPRRVRSFEEMVRWIPRTRTDLIKLYDQTIVQQWPYRTGHQATNYSIWLTTNSKESSYPISPSTGYEPYFIAQRRFLPKYWEAFRGYGLDKQSFVAQVILEGFQFLVLREYYFLHIRHPRHRNVTQREENIVEWQQHFQPYLERHYAHASPALQTFFHVSFLHT